MRIVNVMAASLDGKIAEHALESDGARRQYGFTNKSDQEFVRLQLTTADAVITGANSLRASQAAWQVPNHDGKFATWIVLTNSGLDENLRFWSQDEVEKIIVTKNSKLVLPPSKNSRLILVPEARNIAEFLVAELKRVGLQKVLLFGGGHVNRLFYEAGLVDDLLLTLCPLMLGAPEAANLLSPPLSRPVHFLLESSNRVGDLLFLKYTVKK